MIDWLKRVKRTRSQLADRETLDSRCGLYRVVRSEIFYGRGTNSRGEPTGYPPCYWAMLFKDHWRILATCKVQWVAKAHCEYYKQFGKKAPRGHKFKKGRAKC